MDVPEVVDFNNSHEPKDVEKGRPWVFTACGHVFAPFPADVRYSKCPMCRTVGTFKPLNFYYAPDIYTGVPDHVFSPCGR